MKIIDFELTCDISVLFENKVFIYGTGMYGKKVATVFLQMGIEINGFCETDPMKNEFLGKMVLSVDNLIKDHDESNVLVIIASEKYYREMIDELQTAENMVLCTYYALFISLYLNHESDKIADPMKNNIRFYRDLSLDIAVLDLLKCGMTSYYDILSKPSLVWLYQPGKIGSVTIHKSNLSNDCHLHSLAYAFNDGGDVPATCKDIIAKIRENPVKIITGVREPISRDISLFFQTTDLGIWPVIRWGSSSLYLFGDYSRNSQLDVQILKKRICVWEKSLNHTFEHISREIIENRADEFSWFDYEIKALLGVDIYEHPFDKEKGYTIIEQGNIKILLYKCEKLSQLESVIGCFIGKPGFLLNNANQGDEKVYSYVYRGFREKVKLQKEYFDYYYGDNPRLKHFYTDIEIERFKDRWKERLQEG